MVRLACVIIILMALTLVYNIQLGQGCPGNGQRRGPNLTIMKQRSLGRTQGQDQGCWKFPGLSKCYKLPTLLSMLNALGNLQT